MKIIGLNKLQLWKNSCYTPHNCSYWFCQTKGKCLLDKDSKTPERFKKVKGKLKPVNEVIIIKPRKTYKQKLPTLSDVKKEWSQHPKRVIQLIFNGHDAACACCYSLNDLTFDHIIPVNRGGKNALSNGQILCTKCNHLKSDYLLTIDELRMIYDYIGHEPFESYKEANKFKTKFKIMNLKDVTTRTTPVKTDLDITIGEKGEILNYTPTFNKGDKVVLNKKFVKYNNSNKQIENKVLIVKTCKIADLEDMLVEVVYFYKDNEELVKNPYLVTHFEKYVEHEQSATD